MENPETQIHLLAHARRDAHALTHTRDYFLKNESTLFFANR